MLQECMMSDYYGDLQEGKRSQIGQQKRYKESLSILQLSPVKRLHRIEQSGVCSSVKEKLSMKKRESVKLNESAKNAKQEPKESIHVRLNLKKPLLLLRLNVH